MDRQTPGRGLCLQESMKKGCWRRKALPLGSNSFALLRETVVMFASLEPLDWVLISLCRNPDPKGWTLSSHLIPALKADESLSPDGKPMRVLNRGPHVLCYALKSPWLLCRTGNGQLREGPGRPAWGWIQGPGVEGGWWPGGWTDGQG